MRLRVLRLVVVPALFSCLLIASPTVRAQDWSMYGGGPANDFSAGGPIALGDWSAEIRIDRMPNPVSPIIAYGMGFFGDSRGVVHAFNLSTGEEVWYLDLGEGGAFAGTLAAAGGGLLGAQKTQLVKIDPGSGELIWRTPITEPASDPVVLGERVAILLHRGEVVVLNASSGVPLWSAPLNETPWYTPIVTESKVIVRDRTGLLRAHAIETGEVVWSTTIPSPDRGISPKRLGGGLHVPGERALFSIDEASGIIEWSMPLDRFVVSTPAVDEEVVIVATMAEDGTLSGQAPEIRAYDRSNGEALWTTDLPDVSMSVGIRDGRVWSWGSSGHLTILDKTDGNRLFERQITTTSLGSAALGKDSALLAWWTLSSVNIRAFTPDFDANLPLPVPGLLAVVAIALAARALRSTRAA